MATRLRDLLNIKTAESLEGAAGPIDGNQIVFQNTCYCVAETAFHNSCCVAFVTPAGVSCATIEVWGGGGGGAGTNLCVDDACMSGYSGGSGAYVVRCLNDITEGDRFDMIIGTATSCTTSCIGCSGCFSCVCGPNTELCAQGGPSGRICCNWGCGVICSGSATAYGGDINIDGKPGKYCQVCVSIPCFSYNQFFIPYSGGLTNLCGGWVQVQQQPCTNCRVCNYQTKCDAGEKLAGLGNPGTECFGYIPGLPAASVTQYCECECERPCLCGDAGNPGMIRVTYK